MATGDPGGDPFRDLFEEAMRDVQPIRSRPLAPPARKAPPAKRPIASRTAPARPVRFEIEETGERVEGRVPGFDRRRIARLGRGAIPPEATVDLHGALEADARLAVRAALQDAHAVGLRSVLVIHGRGLHSPDGPVLKKALPVWLAEPPVGAWILAFASAPADLGGPGATLVLLRKRSPRR